MSIKITKDDFFVDEDTIDFGNKRYKVVKISVLYGVKRISETN